MSSLSRVLGVLTLFSVIPFIETVQCHYDLGHFMGDSENVTCEGDFCVAVRGESIRKTCVTGAKKPSATCLLDYKDEMACYCDTDFCNTDQIFRSNFTTLPIVECKAVKLKEYVAAACNTCIRKIEYFKTMSRDPSLYLQEDANCFIEAPSSFDLMINRNKYTYTEIGITTSFFSNACYNISLHAEHYCLYCRCSQRNCNSPESATIPYPISEPTVTCFTSGLDNVYNIEIYGSDEAGYIDYNRLLKNESYADTGTCRGHYCFIASVDYTEGDSYYKGCISANEQGENRIQLGYSFINSIPYYICNTDFCNLDIQTALEEAENATRTVRDNGSIHQTSLIIFSYALFRSFLKF